MPAPSRLLRPRLSWLLVFIPVSLITALVLHEPQTTFVCACLAIMPLAGMVGKGTDELSIRTGPRVGGLLNATFGNLTEIIVSALLIVNGELQVVKASLIGSILGNVLLVLGASLFAGGMRYREQRFSVRSSNVHAASLFMAVIGLIMPTLFVFSVQETTRERLIVSAIVACVLIVVYAASLVFTLVTHQHLFHTPEGVAQQAWPAWQALLLLVVAAVLVGIESELLVESLQPTVVSWGLSRVFIGVIVVAIIGNAAEHAAAVMFALRNQVEVSVEIAFGSATQVALFVAPALVFFSLIVDHPMDFIFTPIEVGAVGLSATIVALLTLDGRSNWLEGLELLGVYVIVGASFFFLH